MLLIACVPVADTGALSPGAEADRGPGRWRSLIGCYRDAAGQFALDSMIVAENGGAVLRQARVLSGRVEPWWRVSWELGLADSVKVRTGMIEGGYVREFRILGDSLVGRGYSHFEDAVPPRSRDVALTAHPISCPG